MPLVGGRTRAMVRPDAAGSLQRNPIIPRETTMSALLGRGLEDCSTDGPAAPRPERPAPHEEGLKLPPRPPRPGPLADRRPTGRQGSFRSAGPRSQHRPPRMTEPRTRRAAGPARPSPAAVPPGLAVPPEPVATGPVEKAKDLLRAIRVLKQVEAEQRPATRRNATPWAALADSGQWPSRSSPTR